MADGTTPTPALTPPSGATTAADATNAKLLNQAVSTLITNISDGSAAVIAKINAIAAAITADIIGGSTGTTANKVLVAKGTTGRALQASPPMIDPATGDAAWGGADIANVGTLSAADGSFSTSLQVNSNDVAITTQTVCASFTFKAPEDETVALILNSQFAWTITQTDTITEVGTSTVTVKIGTTALGGSSNSASTSLNTQAHASSNSVASTNQINVTFASTSSNCENLCLTIWGTRVLAR